MQPLELSAPGRDSNVGEREREASHTEVLCVPLIVTRIYNRFCNRIVMSQVYATKGVRKIACVPITAVIFTIREDYL